MPFYTIRLRDLARPVAVLAVVCEACQHKAKADPFAVAAFTGSDANPRRLNPLLRCAQCGMKGGRFEIEWMLCPETRRAPKGAPLVIDGPGSSAPTDGPTSGGTTHAGLKPLIG